MKNDNKTDGGNDTATVTEQKPKLKKEVKNTEVDVEDGWEVKDRHYALMGDLEPITFTISSRHTSKFPLMYFDENKQYARELRYATNQRSPFVDEQVGHKTLAHIVFKQGRLFVPKSNQPLQKMMSLYHPHKDHVFFEIDEVRDAIDETEVLNNQLDAMLAAREMEIEQAEAILRVELGSKVSQMKSAEIKRDLLMFAKKNPDTFLKLADDENVILRNFAIKAEEQGIVKLSDDRRSILWKSNGVKIMTVPFDEHPFSALAAFLKTDEGMSIYKSIEKKLY